ncbi:MAG: ABC transporter substrate-binding protein [Ruminococcus sp.]|jgi:putative ABC transport system substrate-binding protein
MKNKTVKKILAAALSVVMVSSMLAGCGSQESEEQSSESTAEETPADEADAEESGDAGKDVYKIGVIQYIQHDALDASNEGFFAALDEMGIPYQVDQQNAAGETASCQTISQTLVNNQNDLIFAIGTPAAQAVAGVTSDIPIVLTAVTDPAASGLVESNDAPGGNVTGTSDLTPVADQIDLLKKILPDAQKVGILYCSAESNSEIQASMAREACEKLGMETEDYTVSSSNEIQTVVESAIGKVDALYAPTDNVIAVGMATVGMVANENGIPVICGESGMVDEGGLATYGIDYYELGYMAGQMAAEILVDGKNPADMPIEYLDADKCELAVNEETAEALQIDLSSIEE